VLVFPDLVSRPVILGAAPGRSRTGLRAAEDDAQTGSEDVGQNRARYVLGICRLTSNPLRHSGLAPESILEPNP
jgi:hypothetical protein